MSGPRALLVFASLAASCGGASVERAPAGAPNVLLITIDTLRADRLGLYGYAKPTSPALDAFAAGAVVFEQTEASSPWTLPSLASVMTSEVVSTHNCWNYTSVLDDSFLTLPERLLAAGYDTACVVSHLFTTSRYGLQQGFVHTDDSYAYPEFDPALNITSQVISDRGIRFLDQKLASPDEAPWLLWLHYFDPHREYMSHAGVTEGFVTPGQRAQGVILGDVYDGEVRYTDDHVGRVLEHLEKLGLAGNTLVVVLADHGEEFDDHGGLGHGHSLHHEVVRVPLVLRAPGIAPRRVPELARQVDVLPTVLELVGLSTPPGLAGHSLVPLMKGAGAERIPGALAELDNGPHLADSWRTERWRLIRSGAPEERVVRLYDLPADPRETTDVAAKNPEVVRELLAALEAAKAAGRERSKLFETTTLGQTPATQDDLDALGYGGEDKAPDEEQKKAKDEGTEEGGQ